MNFEIGTARLNIRGVYSGSQVDLDVSVDSIAKLKEIIKDFEYSNSDFLIGDPVAKTLGSAYTGPIEDKRPGDSISEAPKQRTPYFDVGNATGSPGETVTVSVEAWCPHHIDGFHIGGGVGKTADPRSGYGKFRAVGVELGDYLKNYFTARGGYNDNGTPKFFNEFQFIDWDTHQALPEEFWEYGLGFWSIGSAEQYDPIPIPSGTKLFSVQIEILPNTPPGEYELTCKDNHYYTQDRIKRRNYEYTYKPQGFTAVECFSGKLTVV